MLSMNVAFSFCHIIAIAINLLFLHGVIFTCASWFEPHSRVFYPMAMTRMEVAHSS